MLHHWIDRVTEVKEREHGQGLAEYALILLIVVLAAIGTLTIFGTSVGVLLQTAVDAFP